MSTRRIALSIALLLIASSTAFAAPRLQGSNVALLLPRANPISVNYYSQLTKFGDIDGDGRIDVVAGATNGLYVFRQNANGSFAAPVSYLPSEEVNVLAVTNADGVAGNDVIVTESAFNQPTVVRTLRNVGGTLVPSGTVGSVPEPELNGAVADFNGDGRADVVLSDPSTLLAYVFLNDGAGGFSASTSPGVPVTGAYLVATGDVNHDGNPDFVVSGGGANNDSAAVLLGDGTGGFAAAIPTLVTSGGVMTIAELDGAPGQDLVAGESLGKFDLFPSNGDGTFGAPSLMTTVQGSQAGAVTGHFDTDPALDVVVLSWDPYSGIRALLGHGNGTFTAARDEFFSATPFGIDAADVDGDGYDDVVSGSQISFLAAVFMNNRDGSFGSLQTRDAAGYSGLALADMDGDGKLDAVRPNRLSGAVGVFKGAGDGSFAPFASASGALTPTAVATARLNADARPDVLVGTGAFLEVYLNDGAGHLLGPTNYPVGGAPRLASTADLDGDGDQDVIVPSRTASNVAVFLNNGAGSLTGTSSVVVPSGSAVAVALGRFDADANIDLAVASTSEVLVYPGLGNGSFGASPLHLAGSGVPTLSAVDYDGDGLTDLVGGSASSMVYLWRNNGAGGFDTRVDVNTEAYASSNALATEPIVFDFDGDGAKDLLVRTSGQYAVVIPGITPGTFGAPVPFSAGSSWNALALGDLDGDGDMDALLSSGGSSFSSVLSTIMNRQELIGVPGTTPLSRVAILKTWPNPVRGEFSLSYSVPAPGPVRLELVSIAGRVVYRAEDVVREGGTHSFRLGSDVHLAPGVYAARILHAAGAASSKVVVTGN